MLLAFKKYIKVKNTEYDLALSKVGTSKVLCIINEYLNLKIWIDLPDDLKLY